MFSMLTGGAVYIAIAAIVVVFLYSGIRILREYERARDVHARPLLGRARARASF